ncbi:MAG: hypothetical protein POELPBGB_01287 [Bacteroidia bacterium]|nr:hypothetical protein [Bacteroidia bacterium]
MEAKAGSFDELMSDPRFRALVRKKRSVSLVLFGISMVLFFSIPVISSYFPDLFKMRVFGEVNAGLAYLIFQYIAGGFIAWRYAVMFGKVDKETAALVSEFIRKI